MGCFMRGSRKCRRPKLSPATMAPTAAAAGDEQGLASDAGPASAG
jgi:hypothetical protein